MRTHLLSCCVVLTLTTSAIANADIEFFEKKIRPVLATHCYPCHSLEAQKQRGNLLLDSRDGVRKGGDTGPALVPGKPNDSLMLKALRYKDDVLRMPPKGKLPDAIIADIEQWIAIGAPDPRQKIVAKPKEIDFEAARRHWAYQPIRKPPLPAVKKRDWPTAPLDYFILAKLEDKGLSPSPPADPRTLLRRLYFDLIGLPPKSEQVDEFVMAYSAQPQAAVGKVVEELLASPHYGERWGRHWLDVARYADTKDGVLMFGDDRVRPYAYTYREYVVRAFNDDVPFDRFIQEQLAADQIEPKVEPWRLGAMGFLTLGRMFDNNIHDILDDRIDVVTRGLLGLTVSCARCHDHKYDAIPTADYYSLYGVFSSSESPLELPLIGPTNDTPGALEFEKQATAKRQEMQRFLDSQYAMLSETARKRTGDYLIKIVTEPPDPLEGAIYFLSLSPEDLRPQILNRWRRYLERRAQPNDPVFGPWHDLMQFPESELANRVKDRLPRWELRGVHPLVLEALTKASVTSKADVARAYGALFQRVNDESKLALPDREGMREAREALLVILTAPTGPVFFPKSQTSSYMSRGEKDNFSRMRVELDRLAVKSSHAPARAMVLTDLPELHDPRVFVRGNPAQPGEAVPRQFLRIVAGDQRKPFVHGSGRLDLARAITAPDNPLTSRVMVNRVWMHHFGEPLVSTPSDFGTRSHPPSHPELLDYLAHEFKGEPGASATGVWSLKKLHRMILLSSTYQQASFNRHECRQIDPENRLFWRANRRRLDWEAMRDGLLAVSGRLNPRLGGRPVDIAGDARNQRRTIYGMVDRQSLPEMFRAFDFANPDQSVERRPQTTVPQQALFGMNSPFVIEQAKALAARPEIAAESTPERRIMALYRVVLQRTPQAGEIQSAQRFLASVESAKEKSQLTPMQQLSQVLMLTNEMMFLD